MAARATGQPTRAVPYQLTWYACDATSGIVMDELPGLSPTQPIGRRLGAVASNVNFDFTPNGRLSWQSSTQNGRTLLVAVDRATQQPIWAGVTLIRARGSKPQTTLTCMAVEGYLDRRYTGDYIGSAVDKAAIISSLVTPALTNGLPFTVDAPAIGSTMSYSVADGDDRTILSALQEVMGQQGAPEWVIDVAWNSTKDGFTLPIRARAHIGTQLTQPNAVFDYPGVIEQYQQEESYEAGKGANVIRVYGDGQGASRLASAVYTSPLVGNGWPEYVLRDTPAASTTDPTALNAAAAQALAQMATGTSVWTLTATASHAPRIGVDFNLGDNVRLVIAPASARFAGSPGHPDGADVTARCWGWDLDPKADTLTPILVEGG